MLTKKEYIRALKEQKQNKGDFKMKKVIIIELESEADNKDIKVYFENCIHDKFRENFLIKVVDR